MIEASNLIKWFGPILAVDDVSLKVERGEVLGFLGPNGAGKSTSMRMITGFIPPTSGTVLIDGYEMANEPIAARQKIGYLPENAPAYPEMTVGGFLHFIAEVNGFYGVAKRSAVDRAVEICHLKPVLHQSIETLSKGYRHRTCFAQSILADPPILVLDEPTDGLDPNQKREVRELIREMGKTKAIILSTHILEEVDAVCSRLIIIDRGKLVCNGTPGQLRQNAPEAGSLVVDIFERKPDAIEAELKTFEDVRKIKFISHNEDFVKVRIYPARKQGGAGEVREFVRLMINRMRASGLSHGELQVEEGRLEDVFYEVTKAEIEPVEKP